jgi:hypothetical protein
MSKSQPARNTFHLILVRKNLHISIIKKYSKIFCGWDVSIFHTCGHINEHYLISLVFLAVELDAINKDKILTVDSTDMLYMNAQLTGILTFANHFVASGISKCFPVSVRSLTTSGNTAIKSRLSSFVDTVPLIARGIDGELTVDSDLHNRKNNKEITNTTTNIYTSKVLHKRDTIPINS